MLKIKRKYAKVFPNFLKIRQYQIPFAKKKKIIKGRRMKVNINRTKKFKKKYF